MTHTLPQRTSRLGLPHAHAPAQGREGWGPHRNGRPDAAELAADLRALALRAHRVIRDTREAASPFDRSELRALRASLADLEANCLDQNLPGLVPYLKALRTRIEQRLG